VTMSTVGYGDYTPTTSWSKAFTVLYTLVGIIVVFVKLAALMTTIALPLVECLRAKADRFLPQQGYDIDGNGKADYFVPQSTLAFYISKLFLPCCALSVLQLVFSGLFVAVEGWDYGTSLYHCMITATTSGYGDVDITSDGGRVLAFFHIAISVSLLGAFLNEIDLVRQERREMLRRHQVMLAKMDPTIWESLLTDDSVHKIDFVCGMLVNLELVEQNDIDVLIKLWGRTSRRNDDRIERSELMKIAQSYHSRGSVALESVRKPSVVTVLRRSQVVPSRARRVSTKAEQTASQTTAGVYGPQ